MAVNTAGYVSPFDGGNPRIVPGIAFETITGGQTVFASGAADGVSSGLNSLAATDIGWALGASGLAFNGVAIQDGTSGNTLGVATRGVVIMSAGGTVTNGQAVELLDGDSVQNLTSTSGTDVPVMVTQTASMKIGRALNSATSGNFALIDLTP